MICRLANKQDADLYQRIMVAEQLAWQALKAAEKAFALASDEWEQVCTAKRIFEDTVNGEAKDYDSHQRAN